MNIECLILYHYDDFFKNLLYRYKGCYDIELAPVFLNESYLFLKRKYKDYVICFPPSNDSENKKRKFKHLVEIIKVLNLPIYDVFIKEKEYKQSLQKYSDRIYIKDYIKIDFNQELVNKKILLFDDVMTSGQTIKCCLNLLLKHNIKKENLKILILAQSQKSKNLSDFVDQF